MIRKALIVEDHEDIAKLVAQYLRDFVDVVDIALDGESAVQLAADSQYALIVLDVVLPKMSGIEVCESLRASGITAPILLATGRADAVSRLMGTRNGVDDYVLKPFDFVELEERAKRLIECPRARPRGDWRSAPDQVLRIGGLVLDPKKNEVFIDGTLVEGISVKEFEVLYFLGRNSEFSYSRRELMAEIWGVTAPIGADRSGVDLRRLQEKLEPNPAGPRFLRITADNRAVISRSRAGVNTP